MLIDSDNARWQGLLKAFLGGWQDDGSFVTGWASKKIGEHLASPGVQGFGWVVGGELAAVVVGRNLGEAFEVDFLGTQGKFRRRGHMSDLMAAIFALPGIKNLWLEVHDDNIAARDFYQKIGMTQVGVRPGYYRDGGDSHLFSLKK